MLAVTAIFAAHTATIDPELGKPFEIYNIQAKDSSTEKPHNATLIHRVREDSASYKAAILYVHGFNDYFFQAELANRADSAGYEFFAIDLHGHGRSLAPGEHHGFLRDVHDYYPEIDSAVSLVKELSNNLPVVLLGHSTGGLIFTSYAIDRNNGQDFAAIVMNSPFYEFNFAQPLVKLGVPILSKLGERYPDFQMPTGKRPFYGQSIHSSAHGEWNYDTTKKTFISPAQDLGWVRAIRLAQFRIQKGRNLVPPILVMHSSCSIRDYDEWDEELKNCDIVLNVEHIEKYGNRLGQNVTMATIEGGMHDLYLSKKQVRENAYKVTFDFLDKAINKR